MIIMCFVWKMILMILSVSVLDSAHHWSTWKPDYLCGMFCFVNDSVIYTIIIFINKKGVCGETWKMQSVQGISYT